MVNAQIGPTWTARSAQREHRDRSIVNTKIGMVNT